MANNTSTVDSGTTSVFLDIPLLESAAGITLTNADSTGEPFSDEFQVGFPITEDTDFTYEEPFAPVSGTIEHSGSVAFSPTEGVFAGGGLVFGDFSIGFDATRASETASGYFVANTLDVAPVVDVVFDLSAPENVMAESDSLTISEADLLVAPELAEALGSVDLAGADVGDARIDASAMMMTPEPELEADAKNVIIMIGDGMGWEIARAAAISQQIDAGATGNTLSDFYTEGVGTGLPFQNLDGYAIATTGGTYIDGDKDNSALKGDTLERETGVAAIREGYEPENLPGEDANGEFETAQVQGFFPELRDGEIAPILDEFDPNFDEDAIYAQTEDGEFVQVGGFINAYDPTKGRPLPWLEDSDPDYPKNLFPDSANTASTLYSGVKSYNAAIGVDIYEDDIETIGEAARELGKSFGVVSSVPFSHATPGSAVAHVNNRNKTTATESIENFEVALDENGVPLHEEHGDGSHEGEPEFVLDEDGNPIPIEDDNILYQILNETQPEVIIGGGHPDGRGDERYMDLETLEELRNGETVYTFTERGENAAEVLAETASQIDVNEGEKLFGVYGARGQGGNLPWSTANGDYSNTGLTSRLDAVRPLEEGETDEEFIASEIDANPTLADMTSAALDVLSDDEDGFWVSIEGGDIDWAAHDNNLDNMIGATLNFADAVEDVQDWIADNGGYEENMLIVTADHDHYFTLNDNFPQLLREVGAEGLTVQVDEDGNVLSEEVDNVGVALEEPRRIDNLDPEASGHYWGSDPDVKVGWSHHTTIPVPVYYEGAGSEYLDNAVGTGFEQYGFEVPGIEGLIDQSHIAQAQFAAFGTQQGENRDVINLIGAEDMTLDVSAEVNAGFVNIGGFYQAIDNQGTVIDPISGESIAVGEEGYEAAALANSVTELGDGESASLDLAGDSVYVPYLLANGVRFFSSFAEANADGIDHVRTAGEDAFGFEDLLGGGDGDFNDFILTVETV